ncbi:chemotaxis protein CheB [Pelagovum pacificum]|uniref:protein-glutamate O-methyltransferase n=1 Tax=Pelagovum pacificum TaxID=2588711 RepID=A0A5C5GF53_9RHOB|nr:chemotaxis protein CheB [Pelagovum pacificum]QQA43501.1 PAS domain-containing protein [Pelagovum pacificum]TNY33363.1 chemotaxis protein CheR [Pelagovum pacificum]
MAEVTGSQNDGEERASPPHELRFVGIAASAGGLEAASLLVQNLPREAHAVYVIAQHMSPTHKSLLTTLISHETRLPGVELSDDTDPAPDTIYVTPPNTDVTLENGRLRLRNPSGHPATPKPSADRLFKSLASDCGENCVGVVLSGTGSDGSYGVQSIREAGGITIAQDPGSAKYNGMPASAIETGCVDLTLTPEQIGEHLEKILADPRDFEALRRLNEQPSRISDLLQILYARTRVDFREYKENTINRRIARRMTALGIEVYEDYVEYCRASEEELDALYRDLLISVTRFFRDSEQFQQLKAEIATLIESQDSHQLRVWVAGCATGEEAYSIAILVAEALGGPEFLQKSRLQVFATDIDERALEVARRGVYPITAAQDIPREYLDKYFSISAADITVTNELRSVTLFSKHNIFHDPPFIKVDLVSLRNLLIYFNTALQERVLSRILYALGQNGLLFLGTAESVGSMDTWFESRSGSDKIFAKRSGGRRLNYSGLSSSSQPLGTPSRAETRSRDAIANQPNDPMFEALARSVAPNGFLVTRGGDIVRVFGDISPFVRVTEQSALSLNTRLLVSEFRDEATSLMAIATKTREMRSGRWHEFDTPGANRAQLQCYPIYRPNGGEDYCLFAILTRHEVNVRTDLDQLSADERIAYVARIESEMQSTREALQQTVEELQTSNEELQSVNEEMQSTNEELQATNEELETSNEELQATNEELITVNEEMQVNTAELQRVSTELSAILSGSPYVMLVVDQALMIRRASDRALQLFDIGRLPSAGFHLSQCSLPGDFPAISRIASEVFTMRTPRSITVDSEDSIYTINFTPFADSLGQLIGQMISVVEFDMQPFETMSEMVHVVSGIGNWRYNIRTGKLTWSRKVFELHGLDYHDGEPDVEEAIGFYTDADRPMVQSAFEDCLRTGKPFSFEASLVAKSGLIRPVATSASLVRDSRGEPAYIVGVFYDMAEKIGNRMLIANLEQVQDEFEVGFYSYDVANDQPYWSAGLHRILGYDPDTHVPSVQSGLDIIHPDEREMVGEMLSRCLSDAEPYAYRARILREGGSELYCEGRGYARTRDDGKVSHVYGSFRVLSDDEAGNRRIGPVDILALPDGQED